MRPGGGALNGIVAIGGGTEHQGYATQHFHCEVHIASIYQHGTLRDVALKIKGGALVRTQ